MDSTSYRQFHEQQMQNNNGTSALETFSIITLPYFSSFLVVTATLLFTSSSNVSTGDTNGNGAPKASGNTKETGSINIPCRFLIEFAAIILPVVLYVTVLNRFILETIVGLLVICGTTAFVLMRGQLHKSPFILISTERPTYTSLARSLVNMMTAVCILAVDFKCFPRKLAKTETFGFGLMDVGVGLYVFINGVTRDIPKFSTENTLQQIKSSWPLFALGVLRFVVTKEIDYQQHVSEYGVHWNFFLTLAFTKILGDLIVGLLADHDHAKFVAIIIMTLYEMFLQLGLGDFLLSDDRRNFLEANKEGICSLAGYVAIYIAAVYFRSLLRNEETTIPVKVLAWQTLRMALMSICLWKVVHVCHNMFGVSRRLANMGYVIWVAATGTSMFALFMLLEMFYHFVKFDRTKVDEERPAEYGPMVLKAINTNGLFFFLLANLLTGLVNLLFQTLLLDNVSSVLILVTYMFILCTFQTVFYNYGIKLKFW